MACCWQKRKQQQLSCRAGREGWQGLSELPLLQLWNFGCSLRVVTPGLEYITGSISNTALWIFFPIFPTSLTSTFGSFKKKSQRFEVKSEESLAWVFLPDSHPNHPFINFKNAQKCTKMLNPSWALVDTAAFWNCPSEPFLHQTCTLPTHFPCPCFLTLF